MLWVGDEEFATESRKPNLFAVFSFLFFSFLFFFFSFQSFLWLGRVSYGTPSSFGLIYACLRKLMLCAYSILSPVADIVYRRYFFVRNWHIMRAVRFSKGNIQISFLNMSLVCYVTKFPFLTCHATWLNATLS